MKNQSRSSSIGHMMSKQLFLKIFLDLVDKGLLRSEHSTDIVSVNNRLSIAFRQKDLDDMMSALMQKLDLPQDVKSWY